MTRANFLLIAIFVFIAMPAMAIVEITVSGVYTPDVAGTTNINEKKIVITLRYSVVPDPTPTADDITFTPSTNVVFDEGTLGTNSAYFITWSELPSGTNSVTFTLTGYKEVTATVANNAVTFAATGVTNNKLRHDPLYIPGLGYAIIAANKTAIGSGVFPTLPNIAAPNQIIKAEWSDVTAPSTPMPDLFALFEGGGSLNLRVNEPGSTNRLGSKKDDLNYDDNHQRNGRQVVINEVMWARDHSFLGDVPKLIRQQWIELYNRGTTPIKFSDMKFTTSKTHPGPAPETDMLSNNPTFAITWELTGLGQHGSSLTPRRDFKSMQRVNYDDGWQQSRWQIATVRFLPNFIGTPGKSNRAATVPRARTKPARDNPAKNKIIISEIGNFSNGTTDWIELQNVTNSNQSLNNWVLTLTTGFGNEVEIVRFPNYSIPARDVLLLVNTAPWQTPFSMGFDITVDAKNQEFGAGPNQYLIVDDNKIDIPDNDAWLLVLRSNKPWDVGDNRNVYQTGFRVEDVAGPGALHGNFVVRDLNVPSPSYEKKADGKDNGDIWDTKVFPLNGNIQVDGDFLQSDRLTTADKVWVRDNNKQGYLKDAWKQVGFTGIGYDRSAKNNDQHGGTPGYDNAIAKNKVAQLDGGKLIISELMLTTLNNRFTQWIELYNTSKTRGIDLASDSSDPKTGWQLIVENNNSGSWKDNKRNLNITVNLKELFTYIPPNQTVLIVASEGRPSDKDHFPASRVASIYQKFPNHFSMTNRNDLILNAEGGFYIKIVDSDGTVTDEVGNLDGIPPNIRRDIGLDNPYSWNWSTALTEDGHRTSLIRIRDEGSRPRHGVPNRSVDGDLTGAVLPIGINKASPAYYAWVHAVDTKTNKRVPKIWYGTSGDISTPGFVRGIQLPVSLSFFRAALENGEVVIRWTTESETDNAGFNILRSHSKAGEYKQISTALIQGAGTTGERNTYKWVDRTAKPGVVYYYQIEDVSFAGERQLLTTSRLKGYISAKNKLTTTWSELKSLR